MKDLEHANATGNNGCGVNRKKTYLFIFQKCKTNYSGDLSGQNLSIINMQSYYLHVLLTWFTQKIL